MIFVHLIKIYDVYMGLRDSYFSNLFTDVEVLQLISGCVLNKIQDDVRILMFKLCALTALRVLCYLRRKS